MIDTDTPPTSPPSEQPTIPEGEPRFSKVVTLALSVMLGITFFWVTAPRTSKHRIATFQRPSESVERVFERNLEIEDALETSGGWLRALYSTLNLERGPALSAAIDAYAEVLETRVGRSPVDSSELAELRARLAILLEEAHRGVEAETALLRVARADREDLAATVRYAYREPRPEGEQRFESFDLAGLRPGWAADRLRQQLARQTGETAIVEQQMASDVKRARGWSRLLQGWGLAFLALFAPGIALLLAWLFFERPDLPRATALVPPPWSFDDGFAVLVRAASAGLFVSALLAFLDRWLDTRLAFVLATSIAALPMMFLIWRHLLRPIGSSFTRAFGVWSSGKNVAAWIAMTLGLLALEFLGALLILRACGAVGLETHWSERLQERWLWSQGPEHWLNLLGAIAFAPVFEEIGCRGLLYLTLRTRLAPTAAAITSAVVFAGAHGYSLPAFLFVGWSGLVWAIAVERCRSIVPGMICHALTNGAMLVSIMLMYR